MSKNKRRCFIVEIRNKSEMWGWKGGEIWKTVVITNNIVNVERKIENRHWGSEYPEYEIISIYDTLDAGFFTPDINSKDLL
jgi:hypothetical protein